MKNEAADRKSSKRLSIKRVKLNIKPYEIKTLPLSLIIEEHEPSLDSPHYAKGLSSVVKLGPSAPI